MDIIRVAREDEQLGYRRIVKKYGGRRLTLSGAKGALGRLRGSGSLERKKGSGPPKVARTEDKVAEARELAIWSMWGAGGPGKLLRNCSRLARNLVYKYCAEA